MKSSIASNLIKRIAAGALIFYVFSGISSILNYAFYPVIARFVSIAEYGEIQFIVSMFTQLAVGFVVLNILAIIISAEFKDSAIQQRAIQSLNFIASILIGIIVIVGGTLLFTQRVTLGLTSGYSIIALCLSLIVNVPFTVAIGRLQGNDRFIASGVVSILGALFKLIFSLLFVMAGLGVTGAIFGIFTGMAVSLIIIEVLNRQNSHSHSKRAVNSFSVRHHLKHLSFIRNQSIIALLAVTVITLLSAADSITSRIVLSSFQAGHYASVATVTKIILAATSPIMWLALPAAIQRNKPLVFKYIATAFGLSIVASIAFIVAPVFFTAKLVGVNSGDFVRLIPLGSLSMTLCAVAFIFVTVAICLGKLRDVLTVTAVTIVVFFVTLLVISGSSGQLVGALYGQAIGSLCIIIGLFPGLIRMNARQISLREPTVY